MTKHGGFTQERFHVLLPSSILEALDALSRSDEVPKAELLRRVGDLVCTFNIPSPQTPIPPASPGDPSLHFVYHIPSPQFAHLKQIAAIRAITVHELLRQGLILYMMRKRSRHAPAETTTQAAE